MSSTNAAVSLLGPCPNMLHPDWPLRRDLTRLTTLQMVALQENPCTDVETSDAPKAHATGATGGSVTWLEQHVSKLKYRVKVDNMNGAGGTASSVGMAS